MSSWLHRKTFEHATHRSNTVFAYVVNWIDRSSRQNNPTGQCAVFGEGDSVKIGSKKGARFLFASGEPLKEPVAWGGPIVMNTQEELEKAFEELDKGTFIKTAQPAKNILNQNSHLQTNGWNQKR